MFVSTLILLQVKKHIIVTPLLNLTDRLLCPRGVSMNLHIVILEVFFILLKYCLICRGHVIYVFKHGSYRLAQVVFFSSTCRICTVHEWFMYGELVVQYWNLDRITLINELVSE